MLDIKQDLQRGEAYASRALTGMVTLIETHISWVFVLERDVFKVKKPVDFGFLDFRILAQRKAMCEAEVRLNARLAPDVYIGVVPIRVDANGMAYLGDAGDIVDWAVHMRRLPDAFRADALLAAGNLDVTAIDAIAKRIAGFHAGLGVDPSAAHFGAPSTIERNLEENFAQTRATLERYLDAAQADELVRWQRAFLRGHTALFEERVRQGRVRDGHGDLRLEHVYLESAAITILDCIEFNERFRFADVCADIAFLSMDLAGRERVDLAERLLATYARESNDFDLYALVDFYESYRAFVRGKIAALVADDSSVGLESRARAKEDARRYFLLALSADRRPLLLPTVVAVGGLIASGKSTIAERIAAELNAPIVDADRTRKSMLGVAPTQYLPDAAWSGAYDPAFTDRVYAEVLRRAQVVLESGRPVVVDASFRSEQMRGAFRHLAMMHGAPFRFIECDAPKDVCRARLERRRGGVSDGRLAIFDDFCARFEPVIELPSTEHVRIDSTKSMAETMKTLRAELGPGF
ncbi:dephospho-CoA kinase [Pendulispora brunnea]|uniref:Dephospho-CoA kinase n=1 Tax=Pendulispora brunnea TaxID=2905690 RepID=A0ABZ2JYZ5_9BACT